MGSQPQNPEFRNNPENFHPCISTLSIGFLLRKCDSVTEHHKMTERLLKAMLNPKTKFYYIFYFLNGSYSSSS